MVWAGVLVHLPVLLNQSDLVDNHISAEQSSIQAIFEKKSTHKMSETEFITANAKNRRGRPTARDAQQKMAAVLVAARAQFILNGYRATTMEAIALQAGVSKRTLYFWHEDKAALFLACTLEGSRQLPQPEPGPSHDIRQGLNDYAARLVARLSSDDNYGMAQLLAREGRDFPELTAAVRHGHDVYLVQPLAKFLQRHGFETARAQNAAQLFIAMALAEVDRAILLAQPIPTPKEITEHAQFATDIFLFGCLGRQ